MPEHAGPHDGAQPRHRLDAPAARCTSGVATVFALDAPGRKARTGIHETAECHAGEFDFHNPHVWVRVQRLGSTP
jgi:hypothetical protein